MSSFVAVMEVAGDGGQHSSTQFAPTLTVPIGPEEVAHAPHNPILAIGDSSGSLLVPALSSAKLSSIIALKVTGADSFGGPRNQT